MVVTSLGKTTALSETRGSVPIADRQSVHCVPVIKRSACPRPHHGRGHAHKERSETRIALAQEVYHSAATETSSVSPMIEMSDRGLQVVDLKAAGALSSLAVTEVICPGSLTIMLVLPCMHTAPSDWRSPSVCTDSEKAIHPSTTRAAMQQNVALHQPRCAAPTRRSKSSAEAPEKAASAPLNLTAYAPRCCRSTLDTLERCQRPRSANPADLWPVLDTTSAGSEGTVVLNVIVTHTRSWNTCNVKRST